MATLTLVSGSMDIQVPPHLLALDFTHSSPSSCFYGPLYVPCSNLSCCTQTPIHTLAHRIESSPRKSQEWCLMRRQDSLQWSGVGHGQASKLTKQPVYMRAAPFVTLFLFSHTCSSPNHRDHFLSLPLVPLPHLPY